MGNKKRLDNKGRNLRENEYQKPNGMYEFRYKDNEGVRRSVYSNRLEERDKTPKGAKKEFKALRTMEEEIRDSLCKGIKVYEAERITLNDCFEPFIESKHKLRKSTRNNYIYMYNHYVRDTIGKKKLSDIRYTTILDFYNGLVYKKGFEPNSVQVIHNVLNPIFRRAVRDGILRTNPASDIMKEIKNPSDNAADEEDKALTKEQQAAFMKFVSENKSAKKWENIFKVLLWTGMRIGEFTSICWENIDFEENIIFVDHALQYRQESDGKCRYSMDDPKTYSGKRTIPMFKIVREALLAEKEKAEKIKTKKKVEIGGYSNWVFTNRYQNVYNSTSINRAIKRIVLSYNREEMAKAKSEKRKPVLLTDFSAHTFRHTFCTRVCEVEPRIKNVMRIMGHRDMKTTIMVYNSVEEKVKREAMGSIEDKLFG